MDLLSFFTLNGTITLGGVAIACIGLFIAGFVDAIGGGGGLISIPSFMFAGLPLRTVIATNKMASSMGTCVATLKYIRNGFVHWKLVIPCVVLGLTGSTIGAHLFLNANLTLVKILMLVVIPVAGFYVFKTKDLGGKEPLGKEKTLALCCVIALCIGLYDGFYGPGTGTFLMLLLTGVAHLSITDAAGTTKVINLTTNVTALTTFIANGAVAIPVGVLAGCFNIAGNFLGANLFTEKGAKIVRPIIFVVLIVFALRVIFELVSGA